MKKTIVFLFLLSSLVSCVTPRKLAWHYRQNQLKSEQETTVKLNGIKVTPARTDNYRTAAPKFIDILNTDLNLKFNWGKHECIGKAMIQLKPYFYETDSIVLDAQNMIFDGIQIYQTNGDSLLFETNYNQKKLVLKIERKLKKEDTLMLHISYIARPDLNEKVSGKAIKDSKGLYFINTKGKEPNKPVQIWTQGEPESNSNWFPTIDKPNEKFTSSITIYVHKDFTTLSNGEKVSSEIIENLKVEKWVNSKPMPAYLMMMTIGDFDITKDTLHGMEVSYYLEKKFNGNPRNVFSGTSEMIDFYANKLGVSYPWSKYAQVVVRDYVSGAMENTSATLHGEFVQKNDRELVDNNNDGIISHELFHQWFGDLVTCESWSDLVLNEGFASFGEWLWIEHKQGHEGYLNKAYETLEKYLNYTKSNIDDPIVNYNYKNPDDMFNVITYQKGALVFNLLRHQVGDDAFFLVIKNYLNKYAYSNAQIDDLRREFEIVTGNDFRPFFDQWFLKGGHPIIEVRYAYDDSLKQVKVSVEQKQTEGGLYQFPLEFKILHDTLSKLYQFDIHKKKETFIVEKLIPENESYPEIVVDPNLNFIGEIIDVKPIMNIINGYAHSQSYIEKIRALEAMKTQQALYDTARYTLLTAINDVNPKIREKVISWIDWKNEKNIQTAKEVLIDMAKNDVSAQVRALSMQVLANMKNPLIINTFYDGVNDSSYTVAGTALKAMYDLIPNEGLQLASKVENDAKANLFNQISTIYSMSGDLSKLDFYKNNLMKKFGTTRANLISDYADFVIKLELKESPTLEAIQIIKERAVEDENGYIRFSAIRSLKEIYKAYQIKISSEKDSNSKIALMKNLDSLNQSIIAIIDNEQDPYTIGLLKVNGLLLNSNLGE